MSTLMDGIEQTLITTARLRTAVLHRAGEGTGDEGTPVVLIHGNISSSLFFQPLMLALSRPTVAIDLRGFGASESAPVDARRGLRDFSDDVAAVLDALELTEVHLVGWSMGGGVVQQLALDRPELVRSLTLQAPVPPYGFGTRVDGTLCTPDGAGTGGGGGNPEFVQRLVDGDASEDSAAGPRAVFRSSYVGPEHRDAHEDLWVESMLTTTTGEDNYPGDARPSEHWPGFGAGDRGVLNTMSGVHLDLTGIVDLGDKPPILWVRGSADAIVSDESFFDVHTLGKHGVVPGWPGEEIAPPQPMVTQTREVLARYAAAGGEVREEIFEGAGHSPHLEDPERFVRVLVEHLEAAEGR